MLLEHNKSVYQEMTTLLNNNNCCCVVMGTGVGKTYVTSEYLDNNNLKALVVSPRNSINKSWEKHTSRVETVTYQKLANIFKEIDFSKYDIVICDEVHHIGAPKWGKSIKYLIDKKIIPVIGLTEDSVRYTDGGRDVALEFFHGNVATGVDVPTAIENKILNPVTYVGAMYNSDGLKKTLRGKIQSRLYAKLNLVLNNTPTVEEIIKKNMPEGKRKGIIFASTIDDIRFAKKFIKSIYPNVDIKEVHSKQSDIINERNMNWFKKAQEGYLCSVDMISEGVHIKGVNTLIMLRRTESVNLFNQQLGRCLDASSKEPAILFDLVNNQYSIHLTKNKVRIKINSIKQSSRLNIVASEQLIVKDFTKDMVEVLKEIKDNLDKVWTDEEIEILREYYSKEPISEMVKRLPNRSYHSIVAKAQKMGFVRDNRWSEEEDNILREYYPVDGGNVYLRFNGSKTSHSCKNRARKLNLKFDKIWTEEEDAIMFKYYASEGRSICKRLSNRTYLSIKCHAVKLGIVVENKRLNSAIKVRCVETGVVYDSAPIVASILNCHRASVNAACRQGKALNGYHWEYVEDKNDK